MVISAWRILALAAVALALPAPSAAALPVVHSLAELNAALDKAAGGRAALIHFWASWCPACVDELPEIQKLSAALAREAVPLIFVSLDEAADAEKAQALLLQMGLGQNPSLRLEAPDPSTITPAFDVPVGMGPPARRWQAELPATFFRLESGAIAAAYLGQTPVKRIVRELEQELRRHDNAQVKGKPK